MMYDRFDMYVFGPIHMLLLGALLVIPFWQLFSKAGYSGWWSFLMKWVSPSLTAPNVLPAAHGQRIAPGRGGRLPAHL